MIINPQYAIESGWIRNILNVKRQLQPNGIDLTVNSVQRPLLANHVSEIRSKNFPPSTFDPMIPDGDSKSVLLLPDSSPFYLINFNEIIKLPEGVAAVIFKRSTLNRMGHKLESGLWDSGFTGNLGCTVWPSHPLKIFSGDRLAQVVFFRAEVSGVLYDGDYQRQKNHS